MSPPQPQPMALGELFKSVLEEWTEEIDISGRKTQVKISHSWYGERLSTGHSRVVLGQEALVSQPVSFLVHCCGWQIRPDRSEQSSLRSQRRRALS